MVVIDENDIGKTKEEILIDLLYEATGKRIPLNKIKHGVPFELDVRKDLKTDPNTYIPVKVDQEYDDRYSSDTSGIMYRRRNIAQHCENCTFITVKPSTLPFNISSYLDRINENLPYPIDLEDIVDHTYSTLDEIENGVLLEATPSSLLWSGKNRLIIDLGYLTGDPFISNTIMDGFNAVPQYTGPAEGGFKVGLSTTAAGSISIRAVGGVGERKVYLGDTLYNTWSGDDEIIVNPEGPATSLTINHEGGLSELIVRGAKILGVQSFGTNSVNGFRFTDSINLAFVPSSLPTYVTSTVEMFDSCNSFNQDIGGWDVSRVTDMNYMLSGCILFDQALNNWDVSNVVNFSGMFLSCRDFDKRLNGWDMSSAVDISNMFTNCANFNGDIGSWNTSNVTNMVGLFSECPKFNRDISNWDTSKVYNMLGMFSWTNSFNQPIGKWDVSNVIYMAAMFRAAVAFNQDLSVWCVPNILAQQNNFAAGTPAWVLPKPVWGTCPVRPQ